MKLWLALLLTSFSYAALAFPTEVECSGQTIQGQRARVEVERSFGGSLRDAQVTIYGARGTNPVTTRYTIYDVRKWGSRLEYTGHVGFRLEIDLFPDQAPRWGWQYMANLRGMRSLRCRFNTAR